MPRFCSGLQRFSAHRRATDEKKVRRLRILLASKTDNQVVSEDSQFDYRSVEAPDCEPYASFVQRKEQIAAWLRSGYSVKGVWIACRRATPAGRFAIYETSSRVAEFPSTADPGCAGSGGIC